MAEPIQIVKTDSDDTWLQLDKALAEGRADEIDWLEPEDPSKDWTPPEDENSGAATPDSGEDENRNVEPEAEIPPEKVDENPQIDYEMEVEIPLPAGHENVTLGQMKDDYLAMRQRETHLQEREADIASEYGKLAQLNAEMQANGGPLNEEQQRAVVAMQERRIAREMHYMLEAIPEWKDPTVKEQDRDELVKILKPYGISENHINGLADHRMALFFKHHLDLVRRINRAEQVKKEKILPKKMPKGAKQVQRGKKASLENLVQRAKSSGASELEKQAAVEAILGEITHAIA